MDVFNIKKMDVFTYNERMKNVFFSSDKFKLRIIELKPGDEMPLCNMESNVVFYLIEGETEITVNNEIKKLTEGDCLVSEPGTYSMKSINGVKILGIQIFR